MIRIRLVFGTMLCLVFFAGCKKQVDSSAAKPPEPFVTMALEHLRQNLSESEFRLISTDGYVYLNKASGGLDLVRFFVQGDASRSITVAQEHGRITSSWLKMKDGQIVAANNQISISGISEYRVQEISILDGHLAEIKSRGRNDNSVINIRQAENRQIISKILADGKVDPNGGMQWLPEFTVIANIGGMDHTFFSLFWLTNMNPAYLYAYANVNPYEPIEEGGASLAYGYGETPIGEEIFIIENFEYENLPAVNLEKLLNCFGNIPNAGAKYSMTMYVDLPDNDDPTKLAVNFTPGHTFLSMTKSNGNISVTQVFGFYPAMGPLSLLNIGVESKISDNTNHDYDASISMDDIDEYSFNAAAFLAKYYSNGMHYDLNDFNCTDFAIDVFNKARSLNEQISIPDWIGSDFGSNYGSTPNGLYSMLTSSKNANPAKSTNINVGPSLAPAAKGECN